MPETFHMRCIFDDLYIKVSFLGLLMPSQPQHGALLLLLEEA